METPPPTATSSWPYAAASGWCEREISEPCDDVVMATPSTMTAGDWGMFIVDRVADRWGVDHGAGTLVWCEIDLAQDGRSRGAPAAHPPL